MGHFCVWREIRRDEWFHDKVLYGWEGSPEFQPESLVPGSIEFNFKGKNLLLTLSLKYILTKFY